MSKTRYSEQPGSKKDLSLLPDERRGANILIIESNPGDRMATRMSLNSLGFVNYTDAADHLTGLSKIQERKITHILFQAPPTNITSSEFIVKAHSLDPNIIMLPTSYNPTLDDVFALLVLGARGYLVKPFTSDIIEDALNWATNGEKMSEAILFAKDRNEALALLVLSNLDKAAQVMRQAKQFETAQREIPKALSQFKQSVEMAFHFSKGGVPKMAEEIVHFAIERAQGPATTLGRFRKRLAKRKAHLEEQEEKRRSKDDDEQEVDDGKGNHPS